MINICFARKKKKRWTEIKRNKSKEEKGPVKVTIYRNPSLELERLVAYDAHYICSLNLNFRQFALM